MTHRGHGLSALRWPVLRNQTQKSRVYTPVFTCHTEFSEGSTGLFISVTGCHTGPGTLPTLGKRLPDFGWLDSPEPHLAQTLACDEGLLGSWCRSGQENTEMGRDERRGEAGS